MKQILKIVLMLVVLIAFESCSQAKKQLTPEEIKINADYEASVKAEKAYTDSLKNANRESERKIRLLKAQGNK